MPIWGEFMDFDVTIDRDKHIGGSDIPAIMGISTFKTRWELLLEKAGLKEIEFTGNKYTIYGQKMEPKIRDFINCGMVSAFVPNKTTVGDMRCHTDGFNGGCVLEIKTTSHIYETVGEYKVYLVQLLKYMEVNNVTKGLLAVYKRPEDFNLEFDAKRLRTFEIDMSDYTELMAEVNAEIDKFRADLERLKNNPLLTEQDFFGNNELVALSSKVIVFENQLARLKEVEQECKDAKKQLYEEMVKHGIKSWVTPNGTKITMVMETPATTELVSVFDEEAFKKNQPDLYTEYLHEVEKRKGGRSGYVKIALPK